MRFIPFPVMKINLPSHIRESVISILVQAGGEGMALELEYGVSAPQELKAGWRSRLE